MAVSRPLLRSNNHFTRKLLITSCALLLLLACMYQSSAQVKLPQLVRDSMVLQRDAPIKIWGWAQPGEKVSIRFNKKTLATTTGADGKWMATLPAFKAGGPYTMNIDASNHIVLSNILIGDVWICAGQSNMVHQLHLHRDRFQQDIESANYPQIRHFFIPTLADLQRPKDDLPAGYWRSANPNDVLQFSAVAYFFAKKIYDKYRVPIGLINASVGGTPIEAWTSEEGLRQFPAVTSTIQKNKDTAYVNDINRKASAAKASRPKPQDKGLTGPVRWFDTSYVPKGWYNINIPGYWEDQGVSNLDGIVWYRKEIDIPASMTGMPARIHMGRIVDADFLYVNGVLAGNTTYMYPQRRYALPAGMLKPGKNVIVIRVINNGGKGGFVPDKPYYIEAGGQTIDLKGTWQYKVGDAFVPVTNPVAGISLQNQPAALFNAMVAPLTNYTIKGFLWYQGESNIQNAPEYEKLLPALIADWRKQWRQPNAPFLFVQLPNYLDAQYLPAESQWAVLREGQLKSLSVLNTGMAIAIDLGEWNDIHPGNKKDVGVRLALAAERVAYGDNAVVHSGPIYRSAKKQNNKVVLSFNNTGSGLTSIDGEALNWFAIAGADRRFFWAKALIENDKVIVWHDSIRDPIHVRYAWADNPRGVNLYNKEGLPASPFRVDLTEEDYSHMLGQLNIQSIRPGVNGNDPNAPNAANYDEAKANPYPTLPDPLVLKNGKKVTDEQTWWNKRRPEIVEDFDREIYGRVPANVPKVNWEVAEVRNEMNGNIPVITKKLIGHVDNSMYPQVNVDIQLTLSTPANATGPVPVIMELAFVFPPGFRFPQASGTEGRPTWQQQVLARGWGYAVLIPVSIQADNGAGLTQGIIGLTNKGQRRKPDDWGALRAWAWGASRALDYFETDKAVDAKKVGLEGHSRYGKAVAVAMAYDQRFAAVFISSSGEGGVKLHRRNAGEVVENVASAGEYHWMAGNFIKYAGPLTWNDLPVDAHELIALCAPRPVFVSSGNKGDAWVDARGMFMAAVAAGPVYRLLGKKDLGTDEFPPVETGLMKGELTYRQHNEGHTPGPNWPVFLQFAGRYFKKEVVQYTNPILAGFYPDPSICRVNDDYYLVNSTFAYFPGLPIFHSKDLVNWRIIGHAMNRNEQLDLKDAGVSRGLFAPDISYHNGTFYITCTLVDKQGNFVITAKDPAGPWSNPVWLPEVDGIDPSLYFDDDGKTYLLYNSIPPDNKSLYDGHRTIRMRSFDVKNLKVTGEEKIIINGGTDLSKNPVWIEGPHIYKKDGWYYLLCAEGGTYYNHSVVVFRSRSVEGPYISFEGNPILTQRTLDRGRQNPVTSTGHADLVQAGNGSWHAVFLGIRPYKDDHYNTGRETFMVPVVWENGWPVMNKGHEQVQYRYDVPMPQLTKKVDNPFSGNFTYRQDFSTEPLSQRWMFLRNPEESWYSLQEKKGWLTMNVRPQTCAGSKNPSFIAHRQQHLRCTANTSVLFSPKTPNEKAGLVVFQNEHHFYYLCKSVENGKPVIQLYKSTPTEEMELLAVEELPKENTASGLRVSANGDTYDFYYSTGNGQWKLLKGHLDATFLSTGLTGGFVGAVIGLYATSQGKESNTRAYFNWFEYSGDDEVHK